jgi:hypothetical protein
MGNRNKAQQALGKLNNLNPMAISPVLGLIQIATYLEYAALTWTGELTTEFNNILANEDRKKVTIISLMGKLNGNNLEKVTAFQTEVMNTIMNTIANNEIADVKSELLKLANQIGY